MHRTRPDMRNAYSNVLGKLTVPIPAFKIAEETHAGLQMLATKAGVSLPEFVRKLIEIRVHGVDMVASLEAERLRVITGK